MRLHDVDGRDKPGHDAGATDVASPVSSKGTGRRPVRTRKARLPADSSMRLPGRPPGLSHMSKEIIPEFFVPRR